MRLGRNCRIEDHLSQAVTVAQVDKNQRAVVTPAVNPAGQQRFLAGVLGPQFWGYWSRHGLEFDGQAGASFNESLALFGLPLSEPVIETNPTDGKQYLTQHFERARFEFHPENAGTDYEVLLGLLGRELTGTKTRFVGALQFGTTPPVPTQQRHQRWHALVSLDSPAPPTNQSARRSYH